MPELRLRWSQVKATPSTLGLGELAGEVDEVVLLLLKFQVGPTEATSHNSYSSDNDTNDKL